MFPDFKLLFCHQCPYPELDPYPGLADSVDAESSRSELEHEEDQESVPVQPEGRQQQQQPHLHPGLSFGEQDEGIVSRDLGADRGETSDMGDLCIEDPEPELDYTTESSVMQQDQQLHLSSTALPLLPGYRLSYLLLLYVQFAPNCKWKWPILMKMTMTKITRTRQPQS